MSLKLSNNATSLLANTINNLSTSVVITSGDEGNFPTLGIGDWCPITLTDGAGNLEIMRCTARAGVTLTVVRGQEGTTAKNFVAGTTRVDGTLTAAALLALDLTAFTGKLPVAMGGTNASTPMEAFDNLSTISTPMASANIVDLAAATGVYVVVTGNVGITGFGTEQAGARRKVKFTGTPLLTHNATSLILITGANIQVEANDMAELESLGAGNWQMLSYDRASGKPVFGALGVTVDNEIVRADGVAGAAQGSGVTIGDDKVIAGATGLKLESTDAGATSGPNVELYRNSATPADADLLSDLMWYANITPTVKTLVAGMRAILLSATTGATLLEWRTNVASAVARRMALGAGLFMNGALGGDKGVDTINAGGFFLNGLPTSAKMLAGLKVEVLSATQVQVTAAGGLSVTADITVAGLNGLDTGAEAANTWPNVWLIWNGTTAAALLSLSATAPTMPATYTQKLRVGAVRNDAAANLLRTIQYGDRVQIINGTNPASPIAMKSGGSVGSVWEAVAWANFVPPTAGVILGWLQGGVGDGGKVFVAPNPNFSTSFANNAPVGNGNSGITGSNIFTNSQFEFCLETANFYYLSNAGGGSVYLHGWKDNL
ncbi:hypothetical protein [Mesorhizobium huakuii]|uniref:DUF2793 domain-containing protein n=1 Tax=Mesorhizobium huakuii TaxID=28104 RepID=A0A7G6T0V6_9HYPH|nr:hypothetical protein [Mesorhizobium huakuii]QND60388.1 hypothetical protein HB778_30450 [Mesorhizobium huakuii]